MVTARDKYLHEMTARLSSLQLEDAIAHKRGKSVALGSESADSSRTKAAPVAGVRYRSVPVLNGVNFAMSGEVLKELIHECSVPRIEALLP